MTYQELKEEQLARAVRLYIKKLEVKVCTLGIRERVCEHERDIYGCPVCWPKIMKFREDTWRVIRKYRFSTLYIDPLLLCEFSQHDCNLEVLETVIRFDNVIRLSKNRQSDFESAIPNIAVWFPEVVDFKSMLRAAKTGGYAIIAAIWESTLKKEV